MARHEIKDGAVGDDKMPLRYSESQLRAIGNYLARFQKRAWFEGISDKASQPYFGRLLIGIYLCVREGLLPTKKQAKKYMDAVDGRTSQRIIGLAEENGLITIAPSKLDKRVDLLCPTPRLMELVEKELATTIDEFRGVMQSILNEPLPATGAPILSAEKRAVDFAHPLLGMTEAMAMFSDEDREVDIDGVPKRKDYIALFSETIRLMPESSGAYVARGYEYERRNDQEHAISDYSEAIRLCPNEHRLFVLRGYAFEKFGALDQAIADWDQAIRLMPRNFLYYLRRARIHLIQKNYLSALADFSEAIKYDPMDSSRISSYVSRAKAYAKLRQFSHAAADIKKAREIIDLRKQSLKSKRKPPRDPAAL